METKFFRKNKTKNKKRLKSKNKHGKSSFLGLFKFGIIAFAFGITFLSLIFLYFAHDLPDLNKLERINKVRKITMIDEDDEVLSNFGDLYGKYVFYDEMPDHLIKAVVATEDRRFFLHHGVDPIGLIRAAFINFKSGRVIQGGSTISQQLAKIIYLSPDKTFKRKIQELILSIYLETKLTKQQILEAYLNRVYLGSGIYGIDAAAKYYFDKPIQELSIKESAIITGLLKAPSKYSPTSNIDNSGKRAYQVLLNMADAGYINKDEIKSILDEPVYLETSKLGSMRQSYYLASVLDQVNNLIPDDGTDLTIKVAINTQIQHILEKSLKNLLSKYGQSNNVSQGSVVAMTKDGKILGIVGGKSFINSPFNRATQALRQPGSAFKHIIYLNAFENGLTPSDIITDEPVNIGKWQPRNHSRKFVGEMSIREAFAKSVNTIAVKLSEKYGRNTVISLAKKMGIKSPLAPHPSIALGSTEVNLLELVSSYAVIANNGYSSEPYSILEIKNANQEIIFENKINSKKILNQQSVNYIKEILNYATLYGSGHRAKFDPNVSIYGKTGTSSENRDAWFIGFTDELVLGIWLGNDDNSSTKTSGAYLPSLLWHDIMKEIYTEMNN